MGADIARKPTLPAPTDSSAAVDTSGGSVTGTDLATDVSRRTDKTSYSIPEDGSPITISTRKKREKGETKLSRSHNRSQTSLLIEYFEGGKEGSKSQTRRPSVRVKVTPSAAKKLKDERDHIVVSESNGTRRPSYSRRISLGSGESPKHIVEDQSVSSATSVAEDSNIALSRPPVEIEVLNRGQGSDLSGNSVSNEPRYIVPPSDISSMPPDSVLDTSATVPTARPQRSRSISREEIITAKDTLKAPSRRRSRSLSRERIAQKVVEKLGNKPREMSSNKKRHSDKSRSRSISKEVLETEGRSSRRKSGRHRDDESVTTGDSSVLTNSLLDPRRQSDALSFRSGTSKSSINNPKLLETVEDAIRRLILPELKELKKDSKVQSTRSKFERTANPSDLSTSSVSLEEQTRAASRRGHDSHTKKPRVVRRDSRESEEILSSGSKRRKERRRERDGDSRSERTSSRRESGDSTIVEAEKGHRRRGKDHKVRDAAAGALLGGALTAAALKHHDSKSSIDTRERRKKRRSSKSRSRSASVAESEEIFHKHDVPPMPMRSDIDSELTRTSLLSEQTVSTASPTHREVREVLRGSPREMISPGSITPTRTPRSPASLQRGLETHHSNLSTGNLSNRQSISDPSVHETKNNLSKEAALAGAAGGAAALLAQAARNSPRESPIIDEEKVKEYEKNLHTQHPIRRGLSPIQSIASYKTSEPNRDSMEHSRDSIHYAHSTGSLSSPTRDHHLRDSRASYESLSSAASPVVAKSRRPEGINLEKRSEIMDQHEFSEDVHSPSVSYRDSYQEGDDEWFDEQHRKNEGYRDSYASSDPKVDVQRMTNYTDDSLDAPYLDKVTAGQQVEMGSAANPEYVHTPVAVESAVASLYEPSVLEARSMRSAERSHAGSLDRQATGSPTSPVQSVRDLPASDRGSPLKQEYVPENHGDKSFQQRMNATSPPQSVTQSVDERSSIPQMGMSALPVEGEGMPEVGHGFGSPESDITTNPSVIQGPMGGVSHENRDHWPYNPTPPRSKGDLYPNDGERHGLSAAEAGLLGAAVGAPLGALANRNATGDDTLSGGYDDQQASFSPSREPNLDQQNGFVSPGLKDEGYISAAPNRSPGAATPDIRRKPIGKGIPAFNESLSADDPFVGHNRATTSHSHGMPSPIYDSATGRGIEGIQSKDIVALMDHLTVRDAQRNARDTEILVTLVRSAAEMRNSFEDMKKFIAEQNDFNMDTSDRQHEKTAQKILGGPRPQPSSNRIGRASTEDGEDLPTKRKNVFRRALRGLSSKNTAELQNIEGMLVQLLDEVAGLRAGQDVRPVLSRSQPGSYDSADRLRENPEDGYEPEGHAGTSSTGNRSGYFSNNSSRQMDEPRRYGPGRRESENRISTVMEGDEEQEYLEPHEQEVLDHQASKEDDLLSPQRELRDSREENRGVQVPITSPQRTQVPLGLQSAENTPQMSEGKGRKHKSSSSSFFPKISRWSKTTASSVGDTFRSSVQNSAKKERPLSDASRSGSDLGHYQYDLSPDDRLRSREYLGQQENRPPSPLIPSQVSDSPKYQAHRHSINLQHPQPRQGPTGRYQSHLENQAQAYGMSPTSPSSDRWEGELPGLLPMMAPAKGYQDNRHSYGANPGHLSPISDGGYSESSSAMMEMGEEEEKRRLSDSSSNSAPPRPPKIKDDGPLVPERPPKLAMSPGNVPRGPTYADHVAAARAEQLSNSSLCLRPNTSNPETNRPTAYHHFRPVQPREHERSQEESLQREPEPH
ncbi:MAG: hypothetical protein Q9227_003372 [Pyrenula ochraceoflavens]